MLNWLVAIFMKKKKIRVESPTARASKVDENRVEDDLRYSNFEVQNFRCIRNLTVDPMERVNLIAGENNAGKTALLEALFLHSGAFNPQLVMSVAGLRG